MFDLLTTLKLLGMRLWHKEVPGVDELRLEVALKMLKTPHFNAKMNSLKEVSDIINTSFVLEISHNSVQSINFNLFLLILKVCKLIDDSERHKSNKVSIPQETLYDWLLENKVLSVAFESKTILRSQHVT